MYSLSKTKATIRSRLFSQDDYISYDIKLNIGKGSDYNGEIIIKFHLKEISNELFIDYSGKNIILMEINGVVCTQKSDHEKDQISPEILEQNPIKIPELYQRLNENVIYMKFSNKYSNDGNGLCTFIDHNNKQYIYSQCNPYFANRIYPCFDQPDIKAMFNLEVQLPKDWIAISNESVLNEEAVLLNEGTGENDQGIKKVIFSKMKKPISTHLFTIIAGLYVEYKIDETIYNKDNKFSMPISIYCRESFMPDLKKQANQILKISKKILIFYEKFLDYKYPFSKLDHVFCPEYNAGIKGNPGIIIYNDLECMAREQLTIQKQSSRIIKLAHELAYMWFDGLVTTIWWDDLWLNQALADFMAYHCIEELQKDFLKGFNSLNGMYMLFRKKCLAYEEDHFSTSHSIICECLNTDQIENHFDSYIHAKGVAILKQLACLIGIQGFSQALHDYLLKFEWKNANLGDFFECLKKYYKTTAYNSDLDDIKIWQNNWLCKPGLNTIRSEWNPDSSSSNSELIIYQETMLSQFNTLRQHKLKIAFFNEKAKIYDTKDVVLKSTKDKTIIKYDGKKRPSAILMNYEDESYAKIIIDDHSLSFFVDHLWEIENDLTKALIWLSIWQMHVGGHLSSYEFLICIERNIPLEKSNAILALIIEYAIESLEKYTPLDHRGGLYRALSDNIGKLLVEAHMQHKNEDESTKVYLADREELLKEALIKAAFCDESFDYIKSLKEWIDGTCQELKSIKLSTYNMWCIVVKLHYYTKLSKGEKETYYQRILKLDSSDISKQIKTKCQAILAGKDQKKILWESFINPNSKDSIKMIISAMEGFNLNLRHCNDNETEKYHQAYFTHIISVFKSQNKEFSKAYLEKLFPSGDNLTFYKAELVKVIDKASKDKINYLVRKLINLSEELDKRIKAYEACNELETGFPDIEDNLFLYDEKEFF